MLVKKMTGLHLKIIVLITMTIHHMSHLFMISKDTILYLLFENIGRVTFPLVAFLLIEGYRHTKNKKRYIQRMIIPAMLASYPFYKLITPTEPYLFFNNILFTLMISLLMLYFVDKYKKYQILIVMVTCLVTIPLDWGLIGPLLVFWFYHTKRPYIPLVSLFLLFFIMSIGTTDLLTHFGILVTIPLLCLYNGQKGYSSKMTQLAMYWYYPLHLWILLLILNIT